MDRHAMTHPERRLLLNAEPFGFGPAAAIASLAPLLQKNGLHISYIGEKHTLDLQRYIAYEVIYDTTLVTPHEKSRLMNELAGKYDLFVTAMDFDMAEMAQEVGMKTIIYDALTWYWPEIHPAVKNAELYIAQQFFGVKERLTDEADVFPAYRLVPPIVSTCDSAEKLHILLNMGGLQNPDWDFDDTITYAKLMLNTVAAAVPETETLVVTTSSRVAEALNDPRVVTLPRQRMINALEEASVAIMTPGLGNIYDAATFDVPTLWLPPANDSQGQQSKLLAENGCCDESIDWSELTGPIDYKAPQTMVLQGITTALRTVTKNEPLKRKLSAIAAEKLLVLDSRQNSNARKLLQLFGTNGVADICEAIIGHLRSMAYADTK